jgi:hypothetical protein
MGAALTRYKTVNKTHLKHAQDTETVTKTDKTQHLLFSFFIIEYLLSLRRLRAKMRSEIYAHTALSPAFRDITTNVRR